MGEFEFALLFGKSIILEDPEEKLKKLNTPVLKHSMASSGMSCVQDHEFHKNGWNAFTW